MPNICSKDTSIDGRTPLLAENTGNKETRSDDREPFFWLLRNGLPIIGALLLKQSLNFATVVTIGHLGSTELAAVTLGNMVAGISGLVTVYGFLNALETVCSQAWTGSRKQDLGLYLQKACIMLCILLVPITLIWWNSERLLLALGQSKMLAELAGRYLKCFLPGFIGYCFFEAVRRFLQAQGVMSASTYVMLIVAPFNFGLHYVLVFCDPFKLGFVGAPIALSISYWLATLLLLAYAYFVKGHEGWAGWSYSCLRDPWPLWRLAIPCIFAFFLEFCIVELSVLAAAWLSSYQLASQSILLRTYIVSRAVAVGLSSTAATRVGNVLGKGQTTEAEQTLYRGSLLALCIGVLQGIVFLCTRHDFGRLFTKDPAIIHEVAQVLPIFAFFQMVDAVGGVCSGVLRGMGRQRVTAIAVAFAYYVVGCPLSFVLTFSAELEIVGLWSGLAAAFCMAATLQFIYLLRLDWQSLRPSITQQQSKVSKKPDYKYVLNLDDDTLSAVSSGSTVISVPPYDRCAQEEV